MGSKDPGCGFARDWARDGARDSGPLPWAATTVPLPWAATAGPPRRGRDGPGSGRGAGHSASPPEAVQRPPQSKMIADPPGSFPSRSARNAARAGTGNISRSDMPASRSAIRFDRVSASRRMAWSGSESRSFALIRRWMAWQSRSLVSASTPVGLQRPSRTRSHARGSPARRIGTSLRTRNEVWRRPRNRAMSSSCA